MSRYQRIGVLLLLALPASAFAEQDVQAEVTELRQLLAELKSDYEQRITDLEARLQAAERASKSAARKADDALDTAEQTAIDQSSGSSSANAFNPALSAILNGQYARVDHGWNQIPGFMPAGEIGTGESGFALGEAEVNMRASVDSLFYGNLTLALHEEDGAIEPELEESWIQTTSLPGGIRATGGRFFSSAGYLNSFHRHADDFADRPLPYQAFFGGAYTVDGARASWVAPTALLLEVGAEMNWGGGFPATANHATEPGAWTLFAKLGGDAGASNSWLLGIARINADADSRSGGHDHETPGVVDTFSGDSKLTIADFVWKWAPNGNATLRSFKVQGEYFRRDENGLYAGLDYDGTQQGWYLQTVWQFAQRWRVGYRYDAVDTDNGANMVGTELQDPGHSPMRNSLMFDWSPSEFSRLRLQYINDQVYADTDNLWLLQYIVSIGAHGGHQF
ncbi:MAG TPA: hypothetical protein PKK10_02765 [Woeseiaceae bacterium]|nr:hypothetical protein [Woeseiaceae bacterium]